MWIGRCLSVARRSYRRRLITELGEESGRSCAIRQAAERTERFLCAHGETCHHVIGIDPYSLQLGDELSDNFRVRHPAPDLGLERTFYTVRLFTAVTILDVRPVAAPVTSPHAACGAVISTARVFAKDLGRVSEGHASRGDVGRFRGFGASFALR